MSTAEVRLFGGLVALVDSADVELVSGYRWHANVKPHTTYARTSVAMPGGGQRDVVMHRLIMNAPDGVEVDHRNRDGLDNRRANLRLATRQQNSVNRAAGGGTAGDYKGVSWDGARGLWRARIKVDGRRRCLGRFKSEWEAAHAYNAAALAAWGEFAHLNEERPSERPRDGQGSTAESGAAYLVTYVKGAGRSEHFRRVAAATPEQAAGRFIDETPTATIRQMWQPVEWRA